MCSSSKKKAHRWNKLVIAGTNRGFGVKTEVSATRIIIPKNRKKGSRYQLEIARKRWSARAAIKLAISHLKETTLED